MTKVAKSDKLRFQDLMGNEDRWASIDDLVQACDDAGYWSEEFLASTTEKAKKSHLRRLIRTVLDDTGWPVWASVETTNKEGETVRHYKQELLFDPNDYRQCVAYHSDRSKHHRRMAVGYATRCKKRFNKQLPLNFGDGDLPDPKKPR